MKKTWLDTVGQAIIEAISTTVSSVSSKVTSIKAKTDNLPSDPADQSLLTDQIEEHDEHFHNREYWFGKSADQSGNNWGTRASLTPYQAISGDDDWGGDANDEAKVIGSDDTPVRTGATKYDLRRIQVVGASSTTVYLLRIIHGTGTMAEAEAAGQYTECAFFRQAPPIRGDPVDLIQEKIAVGRKTWIRAKNATNNATIDFLVGIHEYPLA